MNYTMKKKKTEKTREKKKGFYVRLINCFAHVFRAKCLPERINPAKPIQSASQPVSQPSKQTSNRPTTGAKQKKVIILEHIRRI